MATTALQNRLDGILLLLLMIVSLLSGLVFGKGYDDRVGVSLISFIILGVVILVVGILQARSSSE